MCEKVITSVTTASSERTLMDLELLSQILLVVVILEKTASFVKLIREL